MGKPCLVVLACSVGITLGTSLGTSVLFTKIDIFFAKYLAECRR